MRSGAGNTDIQSDAAFCCVIRYIIVLMGMRRGGDSSYPEKLLLPSPSME